MKMICTDCLYRLFFKTVAMFGTLLVLSFFLQARYSFADSMDADMAGLKKCKEEKDPGKRLACFDRLTGYTETPVSVPLARESEKEKVRNPAIHTESILGTSAKQVNDDDERRLNFSKSWEPDKSGSYFSIRPYRTNYILPISHNSKPNRSYTLDGDPEAKANHAEAKFQMSFKINILPHVFYKNITLWFAYTQLSFWQLYNTDFSSPFRENNYEPELLLNFRVGDNPFGLSFINVGVNHQSNGRSALLSRSWNRIVATFGFEKDTIGLLLKAWYRIPESRRHDDNPDIYKYLGYGELMFYYNWGDSRFRLMVRNNLRTRHNKGAVQVDWGFPIPFIGRRSPLNFYIQYYNGYGESLVDYNKSVNRIGAGFMVRNW